MQMYVCVFTQIFSNLSDLFTTVIAQKQYTIQSGGVVGVSMPYTVPNGYKVIGSVGFNTGSFYTFAYRFDKNQIDVKNTSGESITATASITILCVKDYSQ